MTPEHKYAIYSRWVNNKVVEVNVKGKPTLKISPPIDFWDEAPPEMLSPEDLLLASVVSCYGVSLPGVATRFHAEFIDFEVEATGSLKEGTYGWEFESVSVKSRILVPTETDKKRMEKAAERAHRFCVISNSLKCPVDLEFEVLLEETIK